MTVGLIVLAVAFFFIFFQIKDTNTVKDFEEYELYLFRQNKKKYLDSEQWKKKRYEALKRDNFSCQICGTSKHLHVHHLGGYDLIPNEPIDCLVTLCSTHHLKEHKEKGFPKTYKEYVEWKVEKPTKLYKKFNVKR